VQEIGRGVIALLIGYPLLLAVGQLLFKRTATRLVGLPMPEQLLTLQVQPSFYAAGLLYAAATVLWVWLLTYIPLSAAYPFVGLSFSSFLSRAGGFSASPSVSGTGRGSV
jgi:hypothetical protein